MTTLQNEFLQVSIRNQGAELTSLFDKTHQIEHLWQGDPEIWGWHAPNLFPVIGACLHNQLLIEGKTYPMEKHGFTRHTEFTLIRATATQALFSLRHTAQTFASFPYQFDFQIEYILEGKRLKTTYRVINEDQKTIYFSVGGHPAFNVPFFPGEDYADYYLEFEKDEKLARHLLSKEGYFNGQTEPVELENWQLALTKNLFNRDALVFKKLASRQVTIRGRKHSQTVTVSFPPFNYLGIWAKFGAPFVCIEPWLGCSDSEGHQLPIQEREDIQHVHPGGTFEAAFSIRLS